MPTRHLTPNPLHLRHQQSAGPFQFIARDECSRTGYHRRMAGLVHRFSRRSLLTSSLVAAHAIAADLPGARGAQFESEWKRYADPATELDVYRLTEPAYSSTLPAYYNRVISRNSGFLVFCCDRAGFPAAFRMDLRGGETRQLTERKDLDGSTLNLLPDNRSFCYFAERTLYVTNLTTLRDREVYTIPEGWERGTGLTVGTDGHALFPERKGEGSRLRSVPLTPAPGAPRTILEAPFAIADPIERPVRGQILYRDADQRLWIADNDGRRPRQLKTAMGRIGPANWVSDGHSVLYLNFPDDRTKLNAIREYTPDDDGDKLVAPTSQYVQFGFNRDTSVFVGASRNAASPVILIMLRVTRRERTLCEHKASHPEMVAPMFAPDAQRIYFQSDRHGKPALYALHVERLVEKIEADKG
jgi:oligogalacturonide lyase